ncbi:optineurin isoform X2 [Callorhinchus milii]|uniref:optineurin isoform X2 n=1 Tax=Callorhinchus milii TaxID=7868 RepID=UPI0004571579|nr:optineurin isoform X2 [Callorhinchus milii]|eukprot:gi/632978273/ref/XP_007905818.1/ PREDICTED: optineurin isoform X2 [Callorhinchus milii]
MNDTAMNINGSQPGGLFAPEEALQQMQELIKENNELKEAIKQTNHAMKERYEELATWREKQREEREYIQKKFEEAKKRLADLTAENETLKSKIQQQKPDGSQGLSGDALLVKGAHTNCEAKEQEFEQMKALVSRLQLEKADLVAMNSELLLKAGAVSPDDSFVEIGLSEAIDENGELTVTKELQCKGTHSQAAHIQKRDGTVKRQMSEELTISQLLRMLRDETLKVEKLEHELRSAKQRLSKLEKGVTSTDFEAQTELIAEEQCASDTRLEPASESLPENSRVEPDVTTMVALVQEQCPNEVEVLKSQVTSLVQDLQEAQKKVDEAEQLKKSLQERIQVQEQKLSCSQVDMDEMRQVKFSNEKLQLQVESLQSEQKMEQMKLADEKRKLVQMQAAYDQLFNDYKEIVKVNEELKAKESKRSQTLDDLNIELDVAKKTMQANQQTMSHMTQTLVQQNEGLKKVQSSSKTELHDLSAQLEATEKALVQKQEAIDRMARIIREHKEELETVAVFKAQADVYCADFHAERAAREAMHEERDRMSLKLDLLVKENSKLKEDLETLGRQSLVELQRRHGNLDSGPINVEPLQVNVTGDFENLPEHACPKCGRVLPDIDSLQIHVMDCIL